MTSRATTEICWGGLLLITLGSCWPHLEISGAPCPCPAGFSCCETLLTCLGPNEICPETYPSSSNDPCTHDSDCSHGESCVSWQLEGGSPGGPQACRRECSPDVACSAPEDCQLTLHDGAPLADLQLTFACMGGAPPAGCEDAQCRDCDPSRLGQTFCRNNIITACFLSVHPTCGVVCTTAMVQDCSNGVCVEEGTSATCYGNSGDNPCLDFDCTACPDASSPERFVCDGTTAVKGCAVADFSGPTCSQICQPVVLDCPEGSICTPDGGAHCAE